MNGYFNNLESSASFCSTGWETPVEVGQGTNLSLTTANDNSATAVFDTEDFSGTKYVAYTRFNPITATWSAVGYLSGPGGTDSSLDGSPDGNQVVAYVRNNAIEVTAFDPVTQIWSTPQNLSIGSQVADSPRIVMNAAGECYLIYRGSDDVTPSIMDLWVVARASDGTWLPRQQLVHNFLGTGTTVSINRLRAGIAGAIAIDGNVFVTRTTSPNVWGAPEPISFTGKATNVRVLVGNLGGYLVLWAEQGATYIRYILAGGSNWSAAEQVGSGGFPTYAHNVLTGFSMIGFGASQLASRIFNPTTGLVSNTQLISSTNGGPLSLAGNINNNLRAVWPASDGTGVYANCNEGGFGWQAQIQKLFAGAASEAKTVLNNNDYGFAGWVAVP